MKTFSLLSSISFFLVFCVSGGSSKNIKSDNNTDVYINTEQIIRKYGYESESHTVETADGYLITMHRIPNESNRFKRYPILLIPGLFGQSINFMELQKNSLAFMLADAGYDVWLGNFRGNPYGRAHVELFPDDEAFWNFTWHESGVYDLPAQIDFILDYTKQEKINLLGYSMGSTVIFVLASTLPEYNNKIEASFHFGVTTSIKNTKSPIFKLLAKFSKLVEAVVNTFAKGEFLPDNNSFKKLAKILCVTSLFQTKLCWNILFMLAGIDPQLYSQSQLSLLLAHFPNGYSYKGTNHYVQSYKSGKFQQYDYGKEKNILEYGSETPPDYNLSLITSPMYFYQGKSDFLSTLEDVLPMSKELPNLKKLHIIDYDGFNHYDFVVSQRSKELVYDIILKDLNSLSDNVQ